MGVLKPYIAVFDPEIINIDSRRGLAKACLKILASEMTKNSNG